jgi:hypothetical protein
MRKEDLLSLTQDEVHALPYFPEQQMVQSPPAS